MLTDGCGGQSPVKVSKSQVDWRRKGGERLMRGDEREEETWGEEEQETT